MCSQSEMCERDLTMQAYFPKAYEKVKDDPVLATMWDYAASGDLPLNMAVDAALCVYSDKVAWMEEEMKKLMKCRLPAPLLIDCQAKGDECPLKSVGREK